MIFYIEAVYLGIIAYVVSVMLTEPEMILSRVYEFLDKHLPSWLSKPLLCCEYCFAGQLGLWFFPFVFPYNVFNHILFICVSILTVEIIKQTINKLR